MLISTKNKKSSIIKAVTLLIACFMLFTLVLTSCDGSDALEAAKNAQTAADAAKAAAAAAQAAADAAKDQADAAKDKADGAITDDDVKEAIAAELANYLKTTEITTTIQTKLTEALAGYFTKAQVTAEIQTKLTDYMKSSEVTAAITSALSNYMKSTEITAAIQAQLADYMTETEISAEIQSAIAEQLEAYMTSDEVNAVFESVINEYNVATNASYLLNLEINDTILDLIINSHLYPTTSLDDTIEQLEYYQFKATRALTVDDVEAIAESVDALVQANKSYPLIAYEAYLAVEELIYPMAGDTYSSQEQMDAFQAAVTIDTGDVTIDSYIMDAIRNYVVDDTTTIDLEAIYNTMAGEWIAILNFGDVTAADLIAAIDAIDDDFASLTIDQVTEYADFKVDVAAADLIYTNAVAAIGEDNINFRLITNLQKFEDAKAHKAKLALLEVVPSTYNDEIATLLGTTGWTSTNKVLYNTYKTADGSDGSIALLKTDVETWATAQDIPLENISTIIPNYTNLVAAYDYAVVQYNAYTAFVDDVKPALDAANAATRVLSNELLFTEAETKLDAWIAGDVDNINLIFIYDDPTNEVKTTFEAGLARIDELNAAKIDADTNINPYIASFAPPTEITIHTKATLLNYLNTTIAAWSTTYNIPSETQDNYIEENYNLVNIADLNSYMIASQALIDEVIDKGQDFVNAVKAIPGYNAVIDDNQATLYSGAKIDEALVLYNTWSDENIITDVMFEGLAEEVSNHYAIWTKLKVQYNALVNEAQTEFAPVIVAIDAIGDVDIYSGPVITSARTSYDAWATTYIPNGTEGIDANTVLTIENKLNVLLTAEETFNTLKVAKDEETQNVIDLIAALGTMELNTTKFDEIIAARAAYDTWKAGIDDTRTEYVVTNYNDLEVAEMQKLIIEAYITDTNEKIDAVAGMTIDPATEATTNEYLNALDSADSALGLFIYLNYGFNDYNYVSLAKQEALEAAHTAYSEYILNVNKQARLTQLYDIYADACAEPAYAEFVDQFTVAYNQQVDRILSIENTTYNGLAPQQEMDRLVTEFQSLIDAIIGG